MSKFNSDPALVARVFAPSDSEADNLPEPSRAFHVSVAGDVSIVDSTNTTVIVPNVQAGTWPMAGVKRVNATDTTASITIVYY